MRLKRTQTYYVRVGFGTNVLVDIEDIVKQLGQKIYAYPSSMRLRLPVGLNGGEISLRIVGSNLDNEVYEAESFLFEIKVKSQYYIGQEAIRQAFFDLRVASDFLPTDVRGMVAPRTCGVFTKNYPFVQRLLRQEAEALQEETLFSE